MAGPELMETAEGGGRFRRKEKLTVEEYLSFLDSQKQHDLTVEQLNQIIDIHGFKKLHKTRKEVLLEAVAELELLNPLRSTMQDNNVSSLAHMTVEEVIKDLDDLQWQECCIKSLHTLNAVDHESSQVQFQTYDSPAPAPVNPKKRRIKRKCSSKIVSASANTNGNLAVVTAASVGIGGETSGVQSLLHSSALGSNNSENSRPKLMPRRKKSQKNLDAMAAHSSSVYAGGAIG